VNAICTMQLTFNKYPTDAQLVKFHFACKTVNLDNFYKLNLTSLYIIYFFFLVDVMSLKATKRLPILYNLHLKINVVIHIIESIHKTAHALGPISSRCL
jgi:hypothetical protein